MSIADLLSRAGAECDPTLKEAMDYIAEQEEKAEKQREQHVRKLQLEPNVSVGPFVFGMDQAEVRRIMKTDFGSEPDPGTDRNIPGYATDLYDEPEVRFEYLGGKLIAVSFAQEVSQSGIEIYLDKVKIWPLAEYQFVPLFGRAALAEQAETFYHFGYSLSVDWTEDHPSLVIGREGYSSEAFESVSLFRTVIRLKKGMTRDECRKLMERDPEVSPNGRSDRYPHGTIRPEIYCLTYDPGDRLIQTSHQFPGAEAVKMIG